MKDLEFRIAGSTSDSEYGLNFQVDNNISSSVNFINDDSTPEFDAKVNFDFSF